MTATPLEAYLSGFDRARREKLRQTLDHLARTLSNGNHTASSYPWTHLTPPDLRDPSRFAKDLSPAEIRRSKRALNGLLRQAWLQDELATDLYHELTSVSWMRTTTQIGPRRRATGDDLIYLKESCRTDITPNGRRDLALISLLASAACNASELIRLDRKALDLERGTLKITPQSAEIRLDRDTLDTLRDWLQVRGSEPGALFTGIDRTNSGVDLRPLTPSAITWILRKRAHQAGVPYLSSEDLRRSSILERYFSNPSATAQSQR